MNQNNVYTALTGTAVVVAIIAVVLVFMRASAIFPNGLLGG